MKIYVGAKYSDRSKARRLMTELEKQGHKITVDWTRHDSFKIEDQRRYALEDVKGVKQANLVIFIFEEHHKYKGCFVEMGVALAKNKRVIILGTAGESCLFSNHPKVKQLPGGVKVFMKYPLKDWLKSDWKYEPKEAPYFIEKSEGVAEYRSEVS